MNRLEFLIGLFCYISIYFAFHYFCFDVRVLRTGVFSCFPYSVRVSMLGLLYMLKGMCGVCASVLH